MRLASRVERSAPCTCAIAIAMTIAVVALRIFSSFLQLDLSGLPFATRAQILIIRNADILIADDDDTSVKFLRRLLSREGHTVSVASTIEGALEACAQKTPDLVVVDLVAPRGHGYELCRKLKE